MARSSLSTRARLIADLEARHIAPAFPRGQLTLMVVASGLVGFLTSFGLLAAGLHAMWLRYGLAVVGAYLGFLGWLRLWIAWHRGWTPDLDVPTSGGSHDQADLVSAVARGGRSGGAGGGGRWTSDVHAVAPRQGASSSPGRGWSGGLDLDLDDGWWLVLAGVLVLGGALAVVYVIYIAPVLLAEVALDAALVTAVYKRLKPHDAQHWSLGVVRRTWLPAAILAVCLAGAGAALQQVAPEARSIGGVVRHLAN